MSQTIFDIDRRQGGKTVRLLRWMADAPENTCRVLVSHSEQAAMNALREAQEWELGLESWQFISMGELLNGYRPIPMQIGRFGYWEFGFDNIELSLRGFTSWPVGYITGTPAE